jgi:hypothetical protein
MTIKEVIEKSLSREKAKKTKKLNLLAHKVLWRVAALSNKRSEELRAASKCADKYWFNTTGAAFYCLCKTGDSNTDWHSLLLENRRCQYDKEDVEFFGKKPRGNVERLSRLITFTAGRKVYYSSANLDIWLTEYLTRKAH